MDYEREIRLKTEVEVFQHLQWEAFENLQDHVVAVSVTDDLDQVLTPEQRVSLLDVYERSTRLLKISQKKLDDLQRPSPF